MDMLFIIRVKFLFLIKWSYSPPPSLFMLTIEPSQWLTLIKYVAQSLLSMCLFGVHS